MIDRKKEVVLQHKYNVRLKKRKGRARKDLIFKKYFEDEYEMLRYNLIQNKTNEK